MRAAKRHAWNPALKAENCESNVRLLRRASQREILDDKPADAEQQNDGNDDLRDGAIEAPRAEAILLNHGKTEGEQESEKSRKECGESQAREAETTKHQVSGDANGCNRDFGNNCERAVIDDAAIPTLVDVAWRCPGGIVHLERERGNDNSGNGENQNDIAHRKWGSDPFCFIPILADEPSDRCARWDG